MSANNKHSDVELLSRFAAGRGANAEAEFARHEAFRLIVLRHGRIVMSACRSVLRSEADAEDAFQATFFVLARKARTIQRRASLASWLHRVAMRIAFRAAARRKKQREQPLAENIEPTSDELELVSTQASLRAVHEAVARLPDAGRNVVLLIYFEGLNRTETAARLGITPGAVQARLKRARSELRRKLALRGATLSVLSTAAAATLSSSASAEIGSLAGATAQTVFHVFQGGAAAAKTGAAQAGAAQAAGANAVSQSLASGVIRAMTMTTALRNASLAIVCLAGVWLAIGHSPSRGAGEGAGSGILPLSAFGKGADGDESQELADAVFVGLPRNEDGNGDPTSDKATDSEQDDQSAEDQANDELPWGKPVDGLQAALRPVAGDQRQFYQRGESIKFDFAIRNVSTDPIEFATAAMRQDDEPTFYDAAGRAIEGVDRNIYLNDRQIVRHRLAPREVVFIAAGEIGIAGGAGDGPVDFDFPVVWEPRLTAGKHRVMFQLEIPDVAAGQPGDWRGTLSTGMMEFEVSDQPAEQDPNQLVWGEEVEGLQAAVRFVAKDKESNDGNNKFEIGEIVEIEFVIRNVSDRMIEFDSGEWREDDEAAYYDAHDKPVPDALRNWYSGWPTVKQHKLVPGSQVVISSGSMGIAGEGKPRDEFGHPVVYVPTLSPGKYAVQFRLLMPDIRSGEYTGWQGTLPTGKTPFEVVKEGEAAAEPDPLELLQSVEQARMEVQSGEMTLKARSSNFGGAGSGTGDFSVVFDGDCRRFISHGHKTTGIIDGVNAYRYRHSSTVIDDPKESDGDYLFDPRTLGITRIYLRNATVDSCLRIDDAQEIKLVGKDVLDGKQTWRVQLVDSYKQQHDFWIEVAEGFPVHRYEYRTELTWDVTTATYEGENPAIPSHVKTESTFKGEWRDAREITVVSSEFGIDVPPETFSLSGLNMPIGTPVSDLRVHRRLGYWNGTGLLESPPRIRDPFKPGF